MRDPFFEKCPICAKFPKLVRKRIPGKREKKVDRLGMTSFVEGEVKFVICPVCKVQAHGDTPEAVALEWKRKIADFRKLEASKKSKNEYREKVVNGHTLKLKVTLSKRQAI